MIDNIKHIINSNSTNAYTERYLLNKVKEFVNNEAGYPAMKVEYKDKVIISLQLGTELVVSKFDNTRQALLRLEEIFRA